MRSRILHESRGRMRVHLYCAPTGVHEAAVSRMSIEQADLLQAYLESAPEVLSASVDERTCNAVIHYKTEARAEVIALLASFDYASAGKHTEIPEHSGRALNREFEDRMFFHIACRLFTRFLLPLPVRTALTAIKAVPFLREAIRSLLNGRLDVAVLDASSISVSILRGEYDSAGNVMFLLGIGEIMEEWTRKKSVEDLAAAMALNVDRVWMRTESGQECLVPVDEIKEGDTILVRTGGVIPLDGIVLEGEGMVNQSSITGEPLPVPKRAGSLLYAGTVMEEGELAVAVSAASGEGRYDRIVRMIEESEKLKSATEDKAVRQADSFVPWTLGATALTWLITRDAARAASILMVDFCCALKLSIPIAVLSAMREAGSHRISVKGGKYLENIAQAETIVFDKTGTLTMASPTVHDVAAFDGNDPKEMLRLAACLEEHYPHTIANAVVREALRRNLDHEEKHSTVEYIVAHGIASSIDGHAVRIGSYHYIFEDEGAIIPAGERDLFDSLPDEYSHLYLAIDGKLAAVLLIDDPLKEEAGETILRLHDLGFARIVMMTGDSERTAHAVAEKVGVDDFYAEVLPEEKAAFIKAEHVQGRKVIMVGDGINDSPALSEADCGIAINSGAAIAREIADVTISEDDLHSLITLRRISDGMMKRIRGNYRKILSFNSFLIVMGILGIFPSSLNALLHNTSTIAISLNSMRNTVP